MTSDPSLRANRQAEAYLSHPPGGLMWTSGPTPKPVAGRGAEMTSYVAMISKSP
jgi:hypothetical protein